MGEVIPARGAELEVREMRGIIMGNEKSNHRGRRKTSNKGLNSAKIRGGVLSTGLNTKLSNSKRSSLKENSSKGNWVRRNY